jgi:hypothetical protein
MNKRSVLLALAFLTCWSFTSSAEEDLQARFEKSLTDLKSLANLDIEFLDTYWSAHGPSDPKTPFSRTFQYSYVASGMKNRATCKLISGTETNLAKEFVSAFDGTNYATYDNQHYLTLGRDAQSSDRGQSVRNPLIAPFMFLTTHSDECLPCILQHTYLISQNLTNGLALSKRQKSDGLIRVSVPGLNLGQKPTTWEIDIDETGNSFAPRTITMVAPGAGIEVVNHLLNYTNLGAYHFPTRIDWTMNSYPATETLISTGTVAVVSAQIPDQIADSVFRLDQEEKSAAVIWDWKVRKLTKMAPELAKVQATHGNVRIVFLVIMFASVVAAIVFTKRFTSKSA